MDKSVLMLMPISVIIAASFGLGWIICTLVFWDRAKALERIAKSLKEIADKMPR
ncbi:unnamed protein product [marine sediment metagenome]|uniref:Uncharacterized protein n=1 Tax=marine sediment metagenome TaxID=412755 RepID=X1R4H1_9ZZZZ